MIVAMLFVVGVLFAPNPPSIAASRAIPQRATVARTVTNQTSNTSTVKPSRNISSRVSTNRSSTKAASSRSVANRATSGTKTATTKSVDTASRTIKPTNAGATRRSGAASQKRTQTRAGTLQNFSGNPAGDSTLVKMHVPSDLRTGDVIIQKYIQLSNGNNDYIIFKLHNSQLPNLHTLFTRLANAYGGTYGVYNANASTGTQIVNSSGQTVQSVPKDVYLVKSASTNGGACVSNSDCTSNNCNSGVCVSADCNGADEFLVDTTCVKSKFEITTTEDTDSFKFGLSASGTFYVDWGDGNTQKIVRTTPDNEEVINHTYSDGQKSRTIRFAGIATGYNSTNPRNNPAIRFGYRTSNQTPQTHLNNHLKRISGSLGAIFRSIGSNTGEVPTFYATFSYCTNLESISDDLFSGITHTTDDMFASTFSNTSIRTIPENLFSGLSGGPKKNMFGATFALCKNITEIPANLFASIRGEAAAGMFYSTFDRCTSLTSIPEQLFHTISGTARALFMATFRDCTGLTSIPAGLFSSIRGEAAAGMFYSTFDRCTSLTSIPEQLFHTISGAADTLFDATFRDCTGLTSIPAGLFSSVTTGAENMFNYTFYGCTGLQSIPAGLFSGITTGADSMFYSTFKGCTNITGYIPSTTFAGLINNNHPIATNMWNDIFKNTNLATECPSGTTQYTTGYEQYWDGHVACTDDSASSSTPTNPSVLDDDCYSDSDCGAGTCDSGVCSCDTNATKSGGICTCNSGFELNAAGTACVATQSGSSTPQFECSYDSDCASDQNCNSNVCVSNDCSGDDEFLADSKCIKSKFEIELLPGVSERVRVQINAQGSFYIDWGDGTSWGVGYMWYGGSEHTYTDTTKSYKIRIGGIASSYPEEDPPSTITIYYTNDAPSGIPSIQTKIKSIHGSLGALFPTLQYGGESHSPNFFALFDGATNLTSVPENLFEGITTPSPGMFDVTFRDSGLTSIPDGLFRNIKGAPAEDMFWETFANCANLSGQLPDNMFAGISGAPAERMFDGTFFNTKITGYVPTSIYRGLTLGGTAEDMFTATFSHTNMETACPEGMMEDPASAPYKQYWDGHVACCPTSGCPAYEWPVPECNTDSDCAGGTCNDGICISSPASECSSNSDCGAGTCSAGTCSCSANADKTVNTCVCSNGYKENNNHECVKIDEPDVIDCDDADGDAIELTDTKCVNTKFIIEPINRNVEFGFILSAKGVFYVDWGNEVQTIFKTDTTPEVFRHDPTLGNYIKFGGTATEYSTVAPTIAFYNDEIKDGNTTIAPGTVNYTNNIDEISGSLATLFPQYGIRDGQYPMFINTFDGATNLAEIPGDLFSGLTGGNDMFNYTFANCSNITSIPANIFNTINNTGRGMFNGTFTGTGISTIPANLFKTITKGDWYLFSHTFENCKSLTTIPNTLFKTATTVPYPYGINYMFDYTFAGCSALTTIPSGLFSYIGDYTRAPYAFRSTFANTAITTIPENLFGNAQISSEGIFQGTFEGCKQLTSVPENLFGGLVTSNDPESTAVWHTFENTFMDCWNLKQIPENLFSKFTHAGKYAFARTFKRAGLTEIPADLFKNITMAGEGAFSYTFDNCTSLTAIPSELFSNLTDGAKNLFEGTFAGTHITSIPDDLFNNFTTGYEHMFDTTFYDTSITKIPTHLFANIRNAAAYLFSHTFENIFSFDNAYIPASTFDGLVGSGSPTTEGMWTDTFKGSFILLTTCPSGTTPYTTGYERYWGGHVACTDDSASSSTPTNPSVLDDDCYSDSDCGAGTCSAGTCSCDANAAKSGGKCTCNSGFTQSGTTCTPCTNKPANSLYTGKSLDSNCPWACYNGYYDVNGTCRTCAADEIIDMDDGSCHKVKFSVVTTSGTHDTFKLYKAFNGTLYIDWGDGTIQKSKRNDNDQLSISHDFPGIDENRAGVFTIRFASEVNLANYPYSSTKPVIKFDNANKIAAVYGSLGELFPQTKTEEKYFPRFIGTFKGASALTTLPSTLFSGLTGGTGMFQDTFAGCTSLIRIPENLFSDITVAAENMFNNTFGCYTKSDTTYCNINLYGYIPASTFAGLLANGAPTADGMWTNTFNGTNLATTCPVNTTSYTATDYTNYKNLWDGRVLCNDKCAGKIDVNGDGTQCVDSKLEITTAPNAAGGEFKFNMSAKGTFYVDWGDGSAVETITRNDTEEKEYYRRHCSQICLHDATCDCSTTAETLNGVYTIRIGGVASGTTPYSTSNNVAAISFDDSDTAYYNQGSILSASGSLGALFPQFGNANGQFPRFYRTFMGQTRLTTIAGTLFRGLRGGSYMFDRTFSDCNKLTDIPYDLFSTISLGSEGMFSYTFSGCKKLAEIPFNLFKAFSLDGATRMFSHTFSDCTGLNFIPNLFTDIASGADYLFESTFGGCSGLADIPSGLFGTRITAGAEGMFDGTFNNCTSLINLPENLFKYITTAATNLFQDTFNHATNLSGYIPKTTFAGLISAGHPTATGMWRRTFHQTNIATTCPTGTSQYITGYESDWNNMVSCQ